MRLRYSADARVDLEEARQWYRGHSAALEERFAEAVARTIETIVEHPRAYPAVDPDVRRASVTVFPYLVYYAIESDGLVVLAVLHGKRHPDTWRR